MELENVKNRIEMNFYQTYFENQNWNELVGMGTNVLWKTKWKNLIKWTLELYKRAVCKNNHLNFLTVFLLAFGYVELPKKPALIRCHEGKNRWEKGQLDALRIKDFATKLRITVTCISKLQNPKIINFDLSSEQSKTAKISI